MQNSYKKFTDNSGLKAGKKYYYKIRGMKYYNNKIIYSKWSKVLSVKSKKGNQDEIKKELKLKSISNLKATSDSTGIMLQWDDNLSSNIDGVEIFKSTNKTDGYKKVCLYAGEDVTSFLDKWGLTADETYYYKVRGMKYLEESIAYSAWSDIVQVKSETNADDEIVDHVNSLTLQQIFQVPDVKNMISNPKKEEDFINNIIYSFMNGNYSLNYSFKTKEEAEDFSDKIRERMALICTIHSDLAAAFGNAMKSYGTVGYISKKNNEYVYTLKIQNLPLTHKQIYSNQKAAVKEAKQIYIDLHKTGKITDSMTESEKAIIISDYNTSRDRLEPHGGDCIEVDNIFYDSAYASLVARCGCCASWTSGFNLVAHIEGIWANGANGDGHILSRIVVDGIEYLHDATNYAYLKTEEFYKQTENFVIYDNILEYLREHSIEYIFAEKDGWTDPNSCE